LALVALTLRRKPTVPGFAVSGRAAIAAGDDVNDGSGMTFRESVLRGEGSLLTSFAMVGTGASTGIVSAGGTSSFCTPTNGRGVETGANTRFLGVEETDSVEILVLAVTVDDGNVVEVANVAGNVVDGAFVVVPAKVLVVVGSVSKGKVELTATVGGSVNVEGLVVVVGPTEVLATTGFSEVGTYLMVVDVGTSLLLVGVGIDVTMVNVVDVVVATVVGSKVVVVEPFVDIGTVDVVDEPSFGSDVSGSRVDVADVVDGAATCKVVVDWGTVDVVLVGGTEVVDAADVSGELVVVGWAVDVVLAVSIDVVVSGGMVDVVLTTETVLVVASGTLDVGGTSVEVVVCEVVVLVVCEVVELAIVDVTAGTLDESIRPASTSSR
jgi:hypothetical protein